MSLSSKIHFKSRAKKDTESVGFPPSFTSILIPTTAVSMIAQSQAWFLPEVFVALFETVGLSLIVCLLFSDAFRPHMLYVFIPFAISMIVGCIARVLALIDTYNYEWAKGAFCPLECSTDNLPASLGIFSAAFEVIVLFAKLVLFFRYTFSFQSISSNVYAKIFLIQADVADISKPAFLLNFNFFKFDCAILAVCIAFELLEGFHFLYEPVSKGIEQVEDVYFFREAFVSWMVGIFGYGYLLVLTLTSHSRDVHLFTSVIEYLPWFFFAATAIRYIIVLGAVIYYIFYKPDSPPIYLKNLSRCDIVIDVLRATAAETLVLMIAIFAVVYQFIRLKTSLQIIFLTLIAERLIGAFYFFRDYYYVFVFKNPDPQPRFSLSYTMMFPIRNRDKLNAVLVP